jgi:hypothetical protein
MLMSTIQRRSFYLLIAALFIFGSRGAAQSTAADQSFKAIPQQIKSNAETRATTKANTVANNATDKLDSGLNKAFSGIGKMFRKKPKPAKDSLVTPGLPVTPTDTTGSKKTSFQSGRKATLIGAAGWCEVIEAWARGGRKSTVVFLKTA